MKYFILLFVIFLTSCSVVPETPSGLPDSVGKFKDGNITCYTYFTHGISCVKENQNECDFRKNNK